MNNFSILLVLLLSCKIFAQNYSASQNLEFIKYLKTNHKATDILLLTNTLNGDEFSSEQTDSLNYYKGWAYYSNKSFDSAVICFSKVQSNSPFFNGSLFYQSFSLASKADYARAIKVLETCCNGDSFFEEFKNFNLASYYLLQKDFLKFDFYVKNFSGTYHLFAQEENDLIRIAKGVRNQRHRSAVLATLMSAIVPGLGKYYAGYRGKAISTFIPVFAFGVMAAESYLKAGPLSPQFIILSGLLSVFYLGNLYGTYYSVKIHQREIEQKNKNEILLNVYVPLCRIFN